MSIPLFTTIYNSLEKKKIMYLHYYVPVCVYCRLGIFHEPLIILAFNKKTMKKKGIKIDDYKTLRCICSTQSQLQPFFLKPPRSFFFLFPPIRKKRCSLMALLFNYFLSFFPASLYIFCVSFLSTRLTVYNEGMGRIFPPPLFLLLKK